MIHFMSHSTGPECAGLRCCINWPEQTDHTGWNPDTHSVGVEETLAFRSTLAIISLLAIVPFNGQLVTNHYL